MTTATYGASAFYGTSAAAPHAAGMAALFMQRFGVQTSAANLTNNIVTPLRTIANTGSNDLGSLGGDFCTELDAPRFQKDTAVAFLQQPTNALVNTSITPAIKIGIYDGEGKLDTYTVVEHADIVAITNDPNGGAAVLSGGGSGSLVLGAATYATAKINLGGAGYTLKATASAAATPPINLMVTSNSFNITTGPATKLVFTVQPTSVVAGSAITPTVKVSVEDSNNNVVTSNNTG